MKITFVTGSQNKYDEAKQTIPDIERHDLDLVEVQGLDPKPIIDHKLEEAKKVLQGNLVVEDISLYFDSLVGLPGPLIKWFMKTIGNDGLVKIAESFGNPKATAKCIIGFSNENGDIGISRDQLMERLSKQEVKTDLGGTQYSSPLVGIKPLQK